MLSTRGATIRAGKTASGYTVSNKLGCAVVRNRVRRRLREIYRLNEQRFRPGFDIVVVARGRSVSAEYRRLEREFLRACAGLGLMKEAQELKRLMLALIRFYRKNISPLTPPCCRFIPTCSEYALEAIEKYGAVKGGWLALKRLAAATRCTLASTSSTTPCPNSRAHQPGSEPSGQLTEELREQCLML